MRKTSEEPRTIFSLNFIKNMNLQTSSTAPNITAANPALHSIVLAIDQATPTELEITSSERRSKIGTSRIVEVHNIKLSVPGTEAEFSIASVTSSFPLSARVQTIFGAGFRQLTCSGLTLNQAKLPELKPEETQVLAAAVFDKIAEFKTEAQQYALNMLAEIALAPLSARGFDLFVRSWQVTGRELAPNPQFQANFDGVDLFLVKDRRTPLIWFPSIELQASCQVGGVTAVATESGRALRPVYDAIRRQHPETAPYFTARYASRD